MLQGRVINNEVVKNTAYTLYFSLQRSDSGGIPNFTNVNTWSPLQISKDGGVFVALTNTPVEMAHGWYSLALTASEMNADKILLAIKGTAGSNFPTSYMVEINTYTKSAAQLVWEYATRGLTVTDAVKLDDIILNEADIPNGNLTVAQALQVIIKRFKRSKNSPKL